MKALRTGVGWGVRHGKSKQKWQLIPGQTRNLESCSCSHREGSGTDATNARTIPVPTPQLQRPNR